MLRQYQNSAQRNWTINRLHDIARLTGWQTARAIATGCETSWVKTAEAGRGPPYTRIEVEREVVPDIWSSPRRLERTIYGLENEEKRLVIEKTDRVHYALGVLSMQLDFEDLDLNRATYRLDSKKKPQIPKSERFPEVQGCQGSGTDESGANVTDQYYQVNPGNTQGGMTNAMLSWKYVLSNLATAAHAAWQWEAKIPDGKIRVRWKCVSSVYGFNMIIQLLIGS